MQGLTKTTAYEKRFILFDLLDKLKQQKELLPIKTLLLY